MSVGYPRIERSVEDRPIIDIGPYGGLAAYAAIMYSYLPTFWPVDWPQDGVIALDDKRVRRYLEF